MLVACGGEPEDKNAEQVLDTAKLGGEGGLTSARIDLKAQIKAEGSTDPAADEPVDITLKGAFQDQGADEVPKFDLDVSLSGGGQSFEGGLISTGDAGFLKVMGQAYEAPPEQFQQAQQLIANLQEQSSQVAEGADQSAQGLALFGIDIKRWLTDVVDDGQEDVGGATTNHISGKVDVPRALQDLAKLPERARRLGIPDDQIPGRGLREQDIERFQDAIREVSFQLFVGAEDDIVRRFTLDFVANRPEGESRAVPERTTIKLDVTFAGVNEDQEINAPEDPKPLAELISGGALGALGGGGQAAPDAGSGDGAAGDEQLVPEGGGDPAAPEGGGGSGRGGASGETGAYLDCINQAQGASELQECQKLLNE